MITDPDEIPIDFDAIQEYQNNLHSQSNIDYFNNHYMDDFSNVRKDEENDERCDQDGNNYPSR
jgi:hypothetical protein